MEELKVWQCSGGHVLGLVKRNGKGIRQLMLYRNAIGEEEEEMADVDVIAVVEGLVMDVRCSICGGVRTWVPGQEAIKRLLERRHICDECGNKLKEVKPGKWECLNCKS